MLGHDDLLVWFQKLALAESARSLIEEIRSSGPSRRVGGGRSNVSGRYPSRKMGVTIQLKATESNSLVSMRWSTTIQSSSILTSRRQSNWITRARREGEWAFCIRPISSSFAGKKRAGKNGRQRKSCIGSKRTIRTATPAVTMANGFVRPAPPMRNGMGFTTVFARRQRLIGCFSETSSFLRTTCGSLKQSRQGPRNCDSLFVG